MREEIRIRQGKEKNLLRHHPWVFSGAIEEPGVSLRPGVYRVVTFEGRFIAWGVYDADSHIQSGLFGPGDAHYFAKGLSQFRIYDRPRSDDNLGVMER